MLKQMFGAGIGFMIRPIAYVIAVVLLITGIITIFGSWWLGLIIILLAFFVVGAASYLADKLEGMSRHKIY